MLEERLHADARVVGAERLDERVGLEIEAFRERWGARDRDAALAAIGDQWVDDIQIMGDADYVRTKVAAYENAGAHPIVFALPWGEDRHATVSATLRALA